MAHLTKAVLPMRINFPDFSHFFIVLALLGVICACDSSRLYEVHHELGEDQWNLVDTLEFSLEELEDLPFKALVGVKYTDDYEFHNLYLRYIFSDSLGQVQYDSMVNLALFDAKTGKPLGGGFGRRYTKFDTLPIDFDQGKMPVKASLVHYMREEQLVGLTSVGLKLLKER
jgi:gliding motility-associated lipoprotein GldH